MGTAKQRWGRSLPLGWAPAPILGALPAVPGFASQLVALVLVPVTLRGFLVESWVVQDVSP